MADSGLSSMILTIAALTVAALVAGSMISLTVSISSSMQQSSGRISEAILVEFTIIHNKNVDSTDNNITVYAINTGEISLFQSELLVFYDGVFVEYNGSSSSYSWIPSWPDMASPDTTFDPNELIAVTISLPIGDSLGTGSHNVLISARGFTHEYWFST